MTVLLLFSVVLVVSFMMQKGAYAASSQSCKYDDIDHPEHGVMLGKWWTAPPLTRASYDFSVEIYGLYQEIYWDFRYGDIGSGQSHDGEGTPILMKASNDVAGSLLNDPVVWTFGFRHHYYDTSSSEYKWTNLTYIQYQGSYNLCKFYPVVPSFILDDFDIYDYSQLYCAAVDTNGHVVRKYFDFVCVNQGTETDYTSAIVGVGSDIQDLENDLQTSEVSVEINEPSYIVNFRDDFFEDSEPTYDVPDEFPDLGLLRDVYSAFIPSEIVAYAGGALLLLVCGWWLRS